MTYQNSTPEEMESFRESYIYPIMPRIQDGIFHITDRKGALGILDTGFIEPNKGQFPYNHAQSAFYYGGKKGYICLFDFGSALETDYAANHVVWQSFFVNFNPQTMVLRLNRERLPKLIPNSAAPREYGYIGYVEAWYPERIAVDAISGGFITRWNQEEWKVEILDEFLISDKPEP
jgi:hypothetical protein